MILPRLLTREYDFQGGGKATLRQNGIVLNDAPGFNLALPTGNVGTIDNLPLIYCIGFSSFTLYLTDSSAVGRTQVVWCAADPSIVSSLVPNTVFDSGPVIAAGTNYLLGTTPAANTPCAVTFVPGTHGTLGVGRIRLVPVGATQKIQTLGPLILTS